MNNHEFRTILLLMRRKTGLTQSQFDRKIGMPVGTTAQYECGQRAPTLHSIKLLCDGIGCTSTELLGF